MLLEEELLGDNDLREASIDQLLDLRSRVNLALQLRAEQEGIQIPPADPAEQPQPGESSQRPASD
jgi:hypothetical protein